MGKFGGSDGFEPPACSVNEAALTAELPPDVCAELIIAIRTAPSHTAMTVLIHNQLMFNSIFNLKIGSPAGVEPASPGKTGCRAIPDSGEAPTCTIR